MAVRFSSTEAYCPVTPRSWRTTCGLPAYVGAEDLRVAGVDREQGGQHLEHGGLAGAVGSEDAEDLAAVDGQVDAVDGALVAEPLDQAVGLDGQCSEDIVGFVMPEAWGRPVSPQFHGALARSGSTKRASGGDRRAQVCAQG